MKIIIYQNREVYKEESKIGNDSENKVETLEFEFPEEYADFTKYIEFQIKGEKYVDLVEGNKYVITREVAKYGKIKAQIVLKKNTENDVMVFKSDIFTLNVSNSINATENLVHTVGIDLIEKIVAKNYEQDVRLNTLEADNTTNKEIISNLQNDNTTNKSDIKSLQDDNETNKTDISNIKQEQTIQNTNIQKNTYDITGIKEKDTNQDKLIEELQTKVVNLEAENVSLKNQIPSGEATGNPIHLTDSSDMECEIVPVGNAEQETGDVTDEEGNVIGASPSPDYPSEIVTVGSNINLCNGINQGYYLNSETYLCGLLSGNNGLIIPITGGKYTISTQINQTRYRVACINKKPIEGKTVTAYKGVNKDGTSNNITIDTSGYAYLIINATDLTKIKIEKGTVATPYSPYGQGSVEIEVCNKNFAKITNKPTSFKGLTIDWNEDDSFHIYGTVNSNDGGSIEISKFIADRLLGKTVTISLGYVPVNNVGAITSSISTINGTWVAGNILNVDSGVSLSGRTIKLENEYNGYSKDLVISYRIYVNGNQKGKTIDYTGRLQLEISDKSSNYIPHKSYTKVLPIQKEFVKIGDYEDTFVKQDGKWYEKHYIGKRIFDGTGDWQIGSSSTDDYYIFQTTITNALNNNTTVNEIYCEQFIYDGLQGVAVKDYENIALNSTSHNLVRIWIKASRLTAKSLTAFKTWLSNNNVTVYYVLAEPELIECTAEQESILNSFYTYKKVTNVSMSGIGKIKIIYKQDQQTINKNYENRLAALEAAIIS